MAELKQPGLVQCWLGKGERQGSRAKKRARAKSQPAISNLAGVPDPSCSPGLIQQKTGSAFWLSLFYTNHLRLLLRGNRKLVQRLFCSHRRQTTDSQNGALVTAQAIDG